MRVWLILSILLLAGCSGPEAAEDPAESEPEPNPEPAPAEPMPEEVEVPPTAPAPVWGALETAALRPGDEIHTAIGQCTTGFFFQNETALFASTAAHCFGAEVTPGSNSDNLCDMSGVHGIGGLVQHAGLSQPMVLVYSSWAAMVEAEETDAATCSANDLALLRIHPDDWAVAHPAMREFGGPTELRIANTMEHGAKVLYHGRTSLLPDEEPLRRHEAYVALTNEQSSSGWMIDAYSVPPGIPGDSGSAVIAASGEALGLMVYVSSLGTNGITNMAWGLDYMEAKTGWRPELATTELLDPGLLPDP